MKNWIHDTVFHRKNSPKMMKMRVGWIAIVFQYGLVCQHAPFVTYAWMHSSKTKGISSQCFPVITCYYRQAFFFRQLSLLGFWDFIADMEKTCQNRWENQDTQGGEKFSKGWRNTHSGDQCNEGKIVVSINIEIQAKYSLRLPKKVTKRMSWNW